MPALVRRTIRGLLLPLVATALFFPVLYMAAASPYRAPLMIAGLVLAVAVAGAILKAADKRGFLPHA